jgi:RND family efflux transporter MFP subunit
MKRIWIVLGIILGIIIIGAAGYLGFRSTKPEAQTAPKAPDTVTVNRCDVEQSVTAPGSVVNREKVTFMMPLTGKIIEILVRPGDMVQAGDVIANLAPEDVRLAILQAQIAVLDAQKNVNNTHDLLVSYLGNYILDWEEKLAEAQKTLETATASAGANPTAAGQQSITEAQTAVDKANKNLAYYRSLVDTTGLEDEIAKARAEYAQAQVKLAQAQNTLAFLQELFVTDEGISAALKAPISGVVLDVKIQSGDTVTAGSPVFVIVDPASVEVKVTVVEEDLPYVEIGQPVEMYFDALPDEEVSGTVDRILPERVSGDRPLYYVYISLDHVPDHLVDGMTADTAILIAHRPQVLCLPRAVVHASSGDKATVKVWNGVTTEERQIEIGLRGDVYLEILSGLEEGEKVVTR